MAGLRSERIIKSLLVFRVASLDIVIGNGLNELALVDRQLLVESATIGQPHVVVGVGRVFGLRAAPVGLQRLFDDLVAHEGDVEPPPRLIHGLGGVEVVVGYAEPVCYFVCCHIAVVLFVITGAKVVIISQTNSFPF